MLDYVKQSKLLKALAHPVRLRIVEGLLSKDECNVDRMVRALRLPQSTVSQHLGILRSSGIVQIRKEGVKACYRILDERIKDLIGVLKG